MKRKIQILIFSCLLFASITNAQENKVVAVDGVFTNKDSAYVVNHLGENFIKEIINIAPDSAQILIGEIGKFGILSIVTAEPGNNKSKDFQSTDNKLFKDQLIYFINNKEVNKSEISGINPSKIVSINILSQLEAAKLYGKEKKCGVVLVTIREE